MKTKIVILLLAMILSGCAPAMTPTPTLIPSTFTPTATVTLTIPTPSPYPTQPPLPFITPDAIQVARWKEYQSALAKSILPFLPPEIVLCEWEILGQNNEEVYIYALCKAWGGKDASGDTPAVILLDESGIIHEVKIPGLGTEYSYAIQNWFPQNVQDRILNRSIDTRRLSDHLEWRWAHPDEPPLVVLSATPTMTPLP